MFDIPYNFRLSVKILTHMMNSTREKNRVQLYQLLQVISCVSIFALATALNKFRFHSLRNKMINLVLEIKYQFDF